MKKRDDLKKILFLFNKGEIVGGGELSFFDLIVNLDKDSFRPFVVCPAKGSLVDKLEKSSLNVSIIKMPSLRQLNVFSIFKGVLSLCSYIRKNKIDLIHANGSRCALYAALATRLVKIPLIWHVRVMARDKALDSFLSKRAEVIVVNSLAVKNRFPKVSSIQNKIHVVYNGIDFEVFNSKSKTVDLRKELSFSSAIPVIGMSGRMDDYKDHKTFLKAIRIVLDQFPTAKFLLAGDGAKANELKKLAQSLKIDHAVHFLGDRTDMVNFYSAIDIFVLSTLSEGFGRVVVEALALKKPVVASKVGGVVEIIQDGFSGFLVKKETIKPLAEAIVKLIRNPELSKKLAAWGFQDVKKRFSIEQHVKEIEQVYLRLLIKSRSNKISLGIDWREFEQKKATGIARYLEGITRYLLLPGQKWELLFFGNQKTAWKNYIPKQSKNVIQEKRTFWWDQVLLPKRLRKEKCELFLSPYFKAPLFSPCPLVLIVNDLIPKKNLYFRLLLKWNIKRAVAVIAISKSVRKELIDFVPKAKRKIEAIPLGVSSQFSPGSSNPSYLKRKFRLEGPYLLYVGNANPHKNIRSLIEVIKGLPRYQLVLCGVGVKDDVELANLVHKEKLIGRVRFIQRASEESLLALYRGAEVFVFPSLAEGFGLPPLEAMACGVPVVASKIETLKEVLGDAALFVDPADPKEMVASVELIGKNKVLKDQLIEKGKSRAVLFSEKQMASTFEELLTYVYGKSKNTLDS